METTDDRPRFSRRRALVGGTTLAATLSGSTAGCLSLLPPVGQQVRFGRVDVPNQADNTPRYRQWMPAQHEVPDVESMSDVSDAHWTSLTPGSLGADALGTNFTIGSALAMATLDYVGYDITHYDYLHHGDPPWVVAEGNIDRSVVTDTVLDGGYSRDGTYHGWEMFDRTDLPRTVAMSDSAVVMSRGDDRRAIIETVLDAGDGRIERRHESDETFASFSDQVGMYPTILSDFGEGFTNAEPAHAAMGYTFDENGGYFVYHHQYAPGETPSQSRIERVLESEMDTATEALSVDVRRDEPHVEIQMRVDRARVTRTSTDDVRPHVMWGVEETGETVTVRLEAGDSIPVDRLEVEPEGVIVEGFEAGTVLEPGDAFVVAFELLPAEEDDVSVFYNYEGTEHDSAAIIHYTPDESDTA